MELAKQVTSLEISKKISELWFSKDSLHWWSKQEGLLSKHEFTICRSDLYSESYRAYSVSELMEYLPDHIETEPDYTTYFVLEKYPEEYMIQYTRSDIPEIEITDKSLVDCLWKTLIYLLSNNLIDGNN